TLRVVSRLSANRVSRAPPGRATGAWSWWNVWLLSNEKPGAQVMDGVMLIGEGARLTDGMVCDTSPLPTSWCRLPPTLSVPQSNRLVKFSCEVRFAVARNGFTVLF